MKKMIALVLVLMFAAMGLSACSSKTTTTVEATEVPMATAEPMIPTQAPTAEAPAAQENAVETPAGEVPSAEATAGAA